MGVNRGEKPQTPPCRISEHQEERHEARGGEEETEAEEDKEGSEVEGNRDRETPRGLPLEVTRVGGNVPPPRGKRRPPGIPPRMCAPVVAGSLCRLPISQRRGKPGRRNNGRRFMATLLALTCCSVSKLFTTPSGAVRRRFTEILAA